MATAVLILDVASAAAQKSGDERRLDLTHLILPLPTNASAEATQRGMAQAREIMSRVHRCEDLLAEARSIEGATADRLDNVRVGDLAPNRQMYDEIPRLAVGAVAGPFRVAEGVQIAALCRKYE